jgi:hypothetical protein
MNNNIDISNAKAFNISLKKAISNITGQKVKAEIINSYKFPNCWVRVYAENSFSNDFRLTVFDACNNDRKGLLNANDVSYGNIQKGYISAYVSEWIKTINNLQSLEQDI